MGTSSVTLDEEATGCCKDDEGRPRKVYRRASLSRVKAVMWERKRLSVVSSACGMVIRSLSPARCAKASGGANSEVAS